MNTAFVGQRDWGNAFPGARRTLKHRLNKQRRVESSKVAMEQLNQAIFDIEREMAEVEFARQVEAIIRLDREFYGD